MQNTAELRRGFLWNTGGNMIYMACQFIFSILVLRLAGQTNSGYFNLAQGYANIFLTVASYGMYSFQVSDARNQYSQYCYIKSRVITISIATGLCACTIALGAFQFGYSLLQCACILLFHAYRMIESATDVFHACAQRHMALTLIGKTYALRGIVSVATFAAGLLLTRHIAWTLLAMVIGNLFIFFVYTLPKSQPYYEKVPVPYAHIHQLLITCMPLAIYSALSTTSASLPKIMMEQVLGSEALGIYAAVTTPVLLLQIGATYLFTPFITLFSTAYAEYQRKEFIRIILIVQGVIACLLPIGWLVSEFLGVWGLETFVGSDMGMYQYLLKPMVISAVLTALVLFYSMLLTIMRCMKGLIISNILSSIAAALFSVPCMKIWHMQGATIAAIFALLIQAICLGFLILFYAEKHFSEKEKSSD